MIDCHIHLERGTYSTEWLARFIEAASHRGLDEIYLLEHSHRFTEFAHIYTSICNYSAYQREWFKRKSDGDLSLTQYISFIEMARKHYSYPIKVRYGLEVCYFEEHEQEIKDILACYPFDFVTGSVHWVDGFGFDHKKELWSNIDVDHTYKRYYEIMQNLIESSLFTGVAHPDSIKVFGHKPSYDLRETYNKLADLLLKHHMYAEQSGGLYLNYSKNCELGMNTQLLSALLAQGVTILTASDAHSPDDVGAHVVELQNIIDNTKQQTRRHNLI